MIKSTNMDGGHANRQCFPRIRLYLLCVVELENNFKSRIAKYPLDTKQEFTFP